MIEISIKSPGLEPVRRSFDAERIGIGRGDDNDLVLADKSCSRNHAEIRCEHGIYRIVDLGSANGIRVDGAKVAELVLSDGVSVKVGESVLTFSLEDDAVNRTILLPDVADQAALLGAPQAPSAARAPEIPATEAPAPAPPVPPASVPPEPIATGSIASAPAEPAVLYLNFQERNQQKSFRLVEGVEYVLGRSPNADIMLSDKKSSKRHATISSRGATFFIRDLGSANKTLVNGRPVEESPLAVDDEIRIGDAKFRVSKDRVRQEDEEFLLARTQLGLPPEVKAQLEGSPAHSAAAPRRSRLPLLIAAAGVVLLLGGAAYWFLREEASSEGAAAPASDQVIVQVAPALTKDLVFDISASGSLKAERSATVSAEVGGRVVDVLVEEGATVTRGQELARLNDRDIRLQIEEARSSLTKDQVSIAKDDFARKQRLFESGVITRSAFDQSKNNYLALEANYASLQARVGLLGEQLAKTRIVAPMAAIVAKRSVSAGEFVGPGADLFVLDSMGEVLLDAEVSDRDVVKIQQGQPVEVTTDAYPGRTFTGAVDIVGSAANSVSRTFRVQARIPNPDLSLRSGMIASLRIVLDSANALVVPADALMDNDGSDRAQVLVVADGVARRTAIRIGRRLAQEVEVLEGLTAGQEVVVYGQQRVTDGAAVETYRKNEP